MHARVLILHIPVIHKGYLDFFERNKKKIASIYLIPDALVEQLSSIKPDIASIPAEKIQDLCRTLGYPQTSVFAEDMVRELSGKPLLLINDRISRALQKRYFPKSDVEWDSVFLRWDIDSIHAEEPASFRESRDSSDQEMMRQAYREAEKSSDWWRRVGAVAVRRGKVINVAHNEGMPSDYTQYQRGAVRDFLAPGVQPELVDTLHAEQKLIAQAARQGMSLDDASLYVTHFPCPVCAKLMIGSGISRCFFTEGWSTLASASLLKAAGIGITKVIL